MYTIAVISEKGGVGKTTIALDLAVAAERRGKVAAILDIDPQATASKWTDRRSAERPWVVPTHAVRLGAAIQQAQAQGVELVVIDTPPHSAMDAAEAARRSDYVVIPVEPHVFALDTVAKAGDLLKLAGSPAACFVINKAPVQGTEAAAALEFIKGQGFIACPIVLHLRAAHRHASNVGQVAAEFEAASKAASEALQLYKYVLRALKTRKGTNGKG
jgi:chromosome partitioning protein